jgi:nitrite reductase (NO-forming)
MHQPRPSHPGLQLVQANVSELATITAASPLALPTATLRILFGLAWAADAALKWFPASGAAFASMLSAASQDQPGFLKPWFGLVTSIASDGRAPLLALGSAALETYLAIALLTGFARKMTYSVGAIYTVLIWATAEGFGGPYVPGISTDVGAAIIYTLLFLMLLINDAGIGSSRLSLDGILERRVPGWRRVAEFEWQALRVSRGADR